MSRREIAELAGINKALLSVWKKRHAGFPRPRTTAEGDFFALAEMIKWLKARRIPDDRLLPTERSGCTYADRITRRLTQRNNARQSTAANEGRKVGSGQSDALAELFGPLAQRVCGSGPQADYLHLLLCTVFVRDRARDQWARVTDLATDAVVHQRDPATLLDSIGAVVDAVLREHGVLPGVRPVFSRLRPEAAEDVIQVLRMCQELDRNSFQAIFDRFAEWGSRDSTEYYTPRGVVHLVTEVLLHDAPTPVRCHDPYLRFGEFLAGAAATKAVEATGYGRHPEQLRLAAMNVAVHGAEVAELLPGDALSSEDLAEQPVSADIVMMNPPFNQKTSGDWLPPEGGWPFGAPPKKNSNYVWLQHAFSSLRTGGNAAVIMPNQAGVSEDKDELAIRTAMIEKGVVNCVIALPAGLFAKTSVPVSIWFLTRTEKAKDSVLLIDARAAGEKVRGRRRLSKQDMQSVVECALKWQAGVEPLPTALDKGSSAVAVDIAEIRCLEYSLNPADYGSNTRTSAGENAVHLSTLCDIQAGPSNDIIKKLDFVQDGVPIVDPAQLEDRRITGEPTRRVTPEAADRLGKYQLKGDDLLCVRTGTLGPCALADHSNEGMIVGTGLLRLRVLDRSVLDPGFLVAFLSLPSTKAWIENRAAGTTIPSISSTNMGKLFVPMPPLDEQQRIGAELAVADAGIAALRKQVKIANEKRTNTAIALFRPQRS
ncbi:N-6 DNA methylase [Nocardia sp. NPDC060256]|uniref:N-6 DNA methylase n=1 Tax=unclassified Nocardia TaxID=2637762 RepID=UPI0036508D03